MTVAIALPVLVIAAFIEVYVSPHLFSALTDIHLSALHGSAGQVMSVRGPSDLARRPSELELELALPSGDSSSRASISRSTRSRSTSSSTAPATASAIVSGPATEATTMPGTIAARRSGWPSFTLYSEGKQPEERRWQAP